MQVTKRNERLQTISTYKILERLDRLMEGLDPEYIRVEEIVKKIVSGLCDKIKTCEIDELCAEVCASLTSNHPDFGVLASRICISNLHKQTKDTFSEKIAILYIKEGIIDKEIYDITIQNKRELDERIDYKRDYLISYFGIKTLCHSYLLKYKTEIVERPQDLFMRVALGIHRGNIEKVIETYDLMSNKYFIHATPTLFNSGTKHPQMSSCFLLDMQDDSIEGIFNTLTQCAKISKNAGGIGLHVHKIRGKGSKILGTGGTSNGLVPMLKVFNSTATYVDQGGNKRPGSIAVYLEPWHNDIFEFLDLRKNTGKDEVRARDLFLGLWVPDLFMYRVENDEQWSLFCPNEAKGLADVWGEEFETLYVKYEKHGIARRTIPAQALWKAIIETQIETGNPYFLYKDSCNRKSNQKNLGTIRGSNLCTEIIQFTSPDEVAVCNLASIALPTFVCDKCVCSNCFDDSTVKENKSSNLICTKNSQFNFQKLREVTRVITFNLNNVIDNNFYPVEEARNSNFRHRPIGIGVQGLHDVFIKLRYPFESEEAKNLNKLIFETIYFSALEASCLLSQELGPYKSYEGSPVSKGVLQFDMWNVQPSSMWDWKTLRENISKYGIRNSLLISPMPTASTSQILGFNECFEPITTNIYTRRTLAGEFQIINSYLLKDLIAIGLWSPEMKNLLIEHEGSVQNIPSIPHEIKELYKTAWEMKMKNILDLAIDRSAYIDQSQSLNIFMAEPTYSKLTSMHFYGFKNGLKTGMYYLRTRPISSAIKFTVDKEMAEKMMAEEVKEEITGQVCEMIDGCLNCGS